MLCDQTVKCREWSIMEAIQVVCYQLHLLSVQADEPWQIYPASRQGWWRYGPRLDQQFFNTTQYYQTQYCINTTFGFWLLPQYYCNTSWILQMHIPLLHISNSILLNTSQYYIGVSKISTTPILHLLYHYYVNNISILHQYYVNTTSILQQYNTVVLYYCSIQHFSILLQYYFNTTSILHITSILYYLFQYHSNTTTIQHN